MRPSVCNGRLAGSSRTCAGRSIQIGAPEEWPGGNITVSGEATTPERAHRTKRNEIQGEQEQIHEGWARGPCVRNIRLEKQQTAGDHSPGVAGQSVPSLESVLAEIVVEPPRRIKHRSYRGVRRTLNVRVLELAVRDAACR